MDSQIIRIYLHSYSGDMGMTAKELREKNTKELEDILKELGRKLHDFRFQLKAGKVKNPHTHLQTKRDIARIKTILREKF